MHKEIEFRWWGSEKLFTEKEKRMWAWNELCFSPFDDIDDGTLMQYIGLKDKNGQKIFEDDIVLDTEGTNKYRNDYQIYPMGTPETAEGRPCICPAFPLQQRCVIYDISNEIHKFKIIGNIHQNPELIENITKKSN